jgi:hypothetical protein
VRVLNRAITVAVGSGKEQEHPVRARDRLQRQERALHGAVRRVRGPRPGRPVHEAGPQVNAADQRELAGLIDKRLIATLGLRPPNSPGWGQLKALKTVRLRSPDGALVEFKAGVTRVSRDYWAVRLHPEVFRVIDQRDTRSLREHSRALDRTRRELERGSTSTPARGVLPPRTAVRPLRLPR